jgi:hypothetical protein
VSARHQVKRLDRLREGLALQDRSGRRNRISSFVADLVQAPQFHRMQIRAKSDPDVFADALAPAAAPPSPPAFDFRCSPLPILNVPAARSRGFRLRTP